MEVMNTNIGATIAFTSTFLKGMKERKSGHVITISSKGAEFVSAGIAPLNNNKINMLYDYTLRFFVIGVPNLNYLYRILKAFEYILQYNNVFITYDKLVRAL